MSEDRDDDDREAEYGIFRIFPRAKTAQHTTVAANVNMRLADSSAIKYWVMQAAADFVA